MVNGHSWLSYLLAADLLSAATTCRSKGQGPIYYYRVLLLGGPRLLPAFCNLVEAATLPSHCLQLGGCISCWGTSFRWRDHNARRSVHTLLQQIDLLTAQQLVNLGPLKARLHVLVQDQTVLRWYDSPAVKLQFYVVGSSPLLSAIL